MAGATSASPSVWTPGSLGAARTSALTAISSMSRPVPATRASRLPRLHRLPGRIQSHNQLLPQLLVIALGEQIESRVVIVERGERPGVVEGGNRLVCMAESGLRPPQNTPGRCVVAVHVERVRCGVPRGLPSLRARIRLGKQGSNGHLTLGPAKGSGLGGVSNGPAPFVAIEGGACELRQADGLRHRLDCHPPIESSHAGTLWTFSNRASNASA